MSGGTVTIAGATPSDFGVGELMIGDQGDGTLNMTGGTITAADEVFFGLGAGSTSTANISGGTITAAGRNVLIGFDGDATLDLSGTGQVSAADEVFIGFNPTSTSVANVSGGTLASNGRSILVGLNGNGTLNVSDAGTVRAQWDVLVGLADGLGEAAAPAGGALGADPAHALRGVAREGDGPLGLLGGFDPGDDDAVGADVERPLDEADALLGDAHEGDRVAADGGADVVEDVAPVQVPVLGIDHDPVQPQGDGHLGDARRLQRHPQAVNGLAGGELLAELADGVGLHGSGRGDFITEITETTEKEEERGGKDRRIHPQITQITQI
jgi:T5SS/PEP-CTERM-associated repeat protein